MFPRKAVGSVVGFGGMAGAIGGMLVATLAGFILQLTGSYMVLFIISGSAYVVAYFIFNLLAPKLQEVNIS
jgi:ACS family hexuronate transporter-like MFS transporter